jgi:hypothetical protein
MSTIEMRSASVVSAFVPEDARQHGYALPASPQPSYQAPVADMRAALQPAPVKPRDIAPVPRITIRAFCENHDVLAVLESAARDRLMSRANLETFAGGIKAAVEFCRHNPVPNLVVVEARAPNDIVLSELEGLADVCDPGTRVLVIGYSNDISFYRELHRRGVSEYLVGPVAIVPLIAAISGIYRENSAAKLGQVFAFVGAKGGVGSSTIAHNVGWTLARRKSCWRTSICPSAPRVSTSTSMPAKGSPRPSTIRAASTKCCSIVS